ncbi:hypothetical protein POM88_002077 [Heracleum sosnowskyi]|uniref:NAC domain-containing protein n=1 Tax=Heracleum sosnowskyi TaxID=360622 RepID=A0AAD8JDR6_9APIA|nr:hypothetical protein POM88_002077 [Heracleum sosnowskyi]
MASSYRRASAFVKPDSFPSSYDSRKKSEGTQLLIKRTLVYYLKAANVKGRGQKTNWIMHDVNEKIVLCGVYERTKQNKDTETKEEEIKSTQESQQKNTAEETKEESVCVDLIKKIDQSHQRHDQHKTLLQQQRRNRI